MSERMNEHVRLCVCMCVPVCVCRESSEGVLGRQDCCQRERESRPQSRRRSFSYSLLFLRGWTRRSTQCAEDEGKSAVKERKRGREEERKRGREEERKRGREEDAFNPANRGHYVQS